MLLASCFIMPTKGLGLSGVNLGAGRSLPSSSHPGTVSTEGRHTDGHSHWHLLRLLAGRLILHVFPGISVQCPNHDGADALTVGMYSWSCPMVHIGCMVFQNKLFPENRKNLYKLLLPGNYTGTWNSRMFF